MTPQTPMLTIINKIIDALDMRQEFETSQQFHVRLENEPYMALVIEAWNAPDSLNGEKRRISVAHYFTQSGDAIADPEIVIAENGYPLQFTQWTVRGSRCYQIEWRDQETQKVMVDLYQKQEAMYFMRMWAKNLRQQGFLDAAKSQGKARKAA